MSVNKEKRRKVFNTDVSEHCVFSIFIGEWISHPLAYEDGTDTVFRNVGY
jgi:hypothetical protein